MDFSSSDIHISSLSTSPSSSNQERVEDWTERGIEVRALAPEEFSLVTHLLDPSAPPLDPNWSRILAAFDRVSGEVVGIIGLQMVLHAEPIILDPRYRGTGAWRPLVEFMDGYLSYMRIGGVYTQPMHPSTVAICEKTGFVKSDFPLFVKYYSPEDSATSQPEEQIQT